MAFQVSVFAENKPGKIERITSILAKHNINIRAITINDSGDYGIIKLLLDRPEDGCTALKEEGVAATLKEIVAVKIGDKPGSLYKVAAILKDHAINVDDAYGFTVKPHEESVFVFQVDNPKAAEKALKDAGYQLLTDKELYLL
ncbi:MAG TPA: ACT domain-containing protein [Spirochaetota bacterium]|nr:ACT domain-containing protein [Spirochaetota bacterium]HOM08661.1 ACT domain-containing protein [Spirochaetota bacterium]HPP48548.1 ACT domain-containing protein [Spirochaetota bacterium]HXK65405.1 ACT domain-containing protein [Spirochaetota bacterium]